jgi:two-component system chemotaxis response regulator CheB
VLSSLPQGFTIPVVLCLHRLKEYRSGFAESLAIDSVIPVTEPCDKQVIKPSNVYLSPSNYHLLIEPGFSFALSVESDINFSRPSIDLTFESAGYAFGNKMAAILLSGANTDGANGLKSAAAKGAYTVIHDPSDAKFKTMPSEALKILKPDRVLNEESIVGFINSLRTNKYV